jgi:peptide/nickel transport system substrate-binding protein
MKSTAVFKTVHWLMLVSVMIALALGAVGVGAQEAPVIIVATNIGDVVAFDPAQNGSFTTNSLYYHLYERLYELPANPNDPLIPNLATGHSVSEDGLVWTFNLREGVTFASGNPFTAEDVVFSWNRVAGFRNEPAQVFSLFVDGVEAVDPLTVQVTLKTGAFPIPVPFFDVLTALPSFSIMDSQLVIANGGSIDRSEDTAGEWLNQNSAGSGPFILTGWATESEVTLVRNENYWTGEIPAIGGVTLRQVNDSTTALQLLETDDVDIAQNLDKDLAERISANPDLTLQAGQTLSIVYLALSPSDAFENSPLIDARVRRAIMLAIDYDGIVNELLGGFAVRPAGVVPIGILGAEESLPHRYERDLDTARALLAEAGYSDGLEITLNFRSSPLGGLGTDILAAKLAADLAEIGVVAVPNIQADSVFRTGRNTRQFSAFVTTFSADFFDPTNWTILFAVPGFANIGFYIGLNNEALQDAAFETLFAPAEERAAAVASFHQMLADEAIYSVLYQPQTIDAVANVVQGYQFHPIALINYADLSR